MRCLLTLCQERVEYTDDIDILQLNLTYGMKPDENRELYSVYTVQNDKLKKYVNNFKIVEWDIDY